MRLCFLPSQIVSHHSMHPDSSSIARHSLECCIESTLLLCSCHNNAAGSKSCRAGEGVVLGLLVAVSKHIFAAKL